MYQTSIKVPIPGIVKKEIPKAIKKEENNEDQLSSMSSTSHNNPAQSSNNNSNFKPHDYGNTDFTKYHNQSKDVLYIAKRLQQVNITKTYKAINT